MFGIFFFCCYMIVSLPPAETFRRAFAYIQDNQVVPRAAALMMPGLSQVCVLCPSNPPCSLSSPTSLCVPCATPLQGDTAARWGESRAVSPCRWKAAFHHKGSHHTRAPSCLPLRPAMIISLLHVS